MTKAVKVELKKAMGDLARELRSLRSAVKEAERLGKISIVSVLQEQIKDLEAEYKKAHKLWNRVNSTPVTSSAEWSDRGDLRRKRTMYEAKLADVLEQLVEAPRGQRAKLVSLKRSLVKEIVRLDRDLRTLDKTIRKEQLEEKDPSWRKRNDDATERLVKNPYRTPHHTSEAGYDPSPDGYIKAPKFFGDLLDAEEKAYLFRDKQLEAQNDSSTTDDLKKDVTKMKKEVKVLEDAAKEIDDIRKT